MNNRKKNGFSLVEISVAIMVVGVGVLGIFALFPAGLDTARASVSDVRAVAVADSVFGYMRAVTNWWPNAAGASLQAPIPGMADVITRASSVQTNKVTWLGINTEEFAFRYRLAVTNVPGFSANTVRSARLELWMGEFGTTTTVNNRNYYSFYSEFYRMEPPQ